MRVGKRTTRISSRTTHSSKVPANFPCVHGDENMAEMPTDEEKWFNSVSCSRYDGKSTTALQWEASFPERVIRWDPTARHVEMLLRDIGLEKDFIGCGTRYKVAEVGGASAVAKGH